MEALADDICGLRERHKEGIVGEREYRARLEELMMKYSSCEGAESNYLNLAKRNELENLREMQKEDEKKARRRLMSQRLVTMEEKGAAVVKRPEKKPLKLEDIQLTKELGTGGFGTVHLGLRKDKGSMLAVKEILFKSTDLKEARKVIKEIKTMKNLVGHPNIVKYISAERKECLRDNQPGTALYIIMEYVSGGSLSGLVKAKTKNSFHTSSTVSSQLSSNPHVGLPEEIVRCYVFQILNGLVFLHSKGIVHRDIKGENILLDPEGRVKLADFGTAAALEDCGEQVGTPWFMAPEVVRSPEDGTHDMKADIWSLGVTIIQLLIGTPPLSQQFSDACGVMWHIAKGSADPITDLPSTASPACTTFVTMCLQRNRHLRPSAEELLNHPWLEGVDDDLSDE